MEVKNIGVKVPKPSGTIVHDKKSPFTGSVKLHGRTFVGTVISDSMQKTVSVQWDRKKFLKKFQRYEKRRSKVKAHNPSYMNAAKGDIVKIMECRPISKTKHFVVIEIIGKEKHFSQRMEAREEAKTAKKEKKVEPEQKQSKKSSEEQEE